MFIHNNEGFTCLHCSREVPPHPTSSRNHCPYCLWSLHVDVSPGDRLNTCRGLMRPVGIEAREGKMKILYACEKCGVAAKNKVAPDDNSDKIVELSTKVT